MPRPDAIGSEISVKSIEDADLVLAELSWLQNEKDRLDAVTKQKIEALKTEYQQKAVVTVEGERLAIADRAAALMGPLIKWVVKNVASHFKGKKKSIDLAHGTLGLRQQPRRKRRQTQHH